MLSQAGCNEIREDAFRTVAEAAWAVQSQHERFLFKKPRRQDDPSRAAWMNANNVWQAQVRARKAARTAAT